MIENATALRIRLADLNHSPDARHYIELLDAYARDSMGRGRPLAGRVKGKLIEDLRNHPTVSVFLAFDQDRAVGFATCFGGYSTFRARPLLNIHDIAVLAGYRGQGVGRLLLKAVEKHARRLDCCKLTLEVREDNPVARALYRRHGFTAAQIENRAVQYLFLERPLDPD